MSTHRRAPRPLLALCLLSLAACYARPAEPDPAPPAPPAAPEPVPDDVGAFAFSLTVTPTDVRCVRATITTALGNETARNFDVPPPDGTSRGTESRFRFNGLPPGKVRIFVEAFNTFCSGLAPTTPATWVSQAPVEVELLPGLTLEGVNIVLVRAGHIGVLGDFRDPNTSVFFNFGGWKAPATIVGTSVESPVLGSLFNGSSSTFTPNFFFTGDGFGFSLGTTCQAGETCCRTGQPVPPATSCLVRVVFRPGAAVKHQAMLEAGSSVFVPVSGTGTVRGNASLTPPDANLGAVAQLTTTVVNFTLSNGNPTPFPTAAFVTGDSEFQIIGGSCLGLTELEPGASCLISVRYAASALGLRTAALSVGAMTGGLQANLTATTVAAPFAAITPFTKDFGSVAVGQSADLTLTVLNPTAVSVALNHSFSGPNASEFARLNGVGGTCSTLLPSGGSCIVFIRFSPTSVGSKAATFSMGADLTTSKLTGIGVSAGTVRFNADAFDLGEVALGETHTQVLTLSNTTPNAFTIAPSLSNPNDFSRVGGTCGSTLPAGSTCTFVIAFTPTGAGSKTGTLSAGPGSVTTTLSGTAFDGGNVVVTPLAQNYGNVDVGQSRDATFTLSSSMPSAFTLNIGVGNNPTGEFSRQGGTCGATLPAHDTCSIIVRFAPVTAGAKMATLSIGAGVPTAALSGAGVVPASPITNLVVADHTAWTVQTNFHGPSASGATPTVPGVSPFIDRSSVVASSPNGVLDGKTWIRTAADSKNFGIGLMNPPPLASLTVTGRFLYLLVDNRHNTGSRPTWLEPMLYTDQGFDVIINDGTATQKAYSVWRRPVTSGSTVTLPAVANAIAPGYIVVVE